MNFSFLRLLAAPVVVSIALLPPIGRARINSTPDLNMSSQLPKSGRVSPGQSPFSLGMKDLLLPSSESQTLPSHMQVAIQERLTLNATSAIIHSRKDLKNIRTTQSNNLVTSSPQDFLITPAYSEQISFSWVFGGCLIPDMIWEHILIDVPGMNMDKEEFCQAYKDLFD